MSRCVAGSSPFDYEMSELTWENGQLAVHGLGPPRAPCSKFPGWENPRATTGTLESIVDQATTAFPSSSKPPQLHHHPHPAAAEPVPGWERHRQGVNATSAPPLSNINPAAAMDALVPSSSETHHAPLAAGPSTEDDYTNTACGSQSGGMESVTLGGSSSRHLTIDTCGTDVAAGFTSASRGSPGNTDSGKRSRKTPSGAGNNDGDSVCYQRAQREEASRNEVGKKAKGKSYGSSGSRTAFVHNQSERKRRDRINQRLKALQRLVPNSSKTNTASVLDEAIEYLKQLQAQVYMMSTMGMSPLIFPQLALQQQQQQLQLSMMAPTVMGMGMEMGMGLGMRMVDLNRLGCPNIPIRIAAMPHPTSFMPEPSPASSTFFTCPSQPVNMDAYNRMAAWYERPHQPPPTSKDRPS